MYGRSNSGGGNGMGDGIRRYFAQSGTPFTLGLIAVTVVLYFVSLAARGALMPWLMFSTTGWLRLFWTALTWPVAAGGGAGLGDPISLLFAAGWAFLFLGSLERSWGSRDTATFFAATTFLTAFGQWLGSLLVGPGVLYGLWAAVGPAAVAWSLTNRREQITLFFFPLPAFAFGILGAAMVWYYGGAAFGNPLLGLFALAGCALAYWYANGGRYLLASSGTTRGGGGSGRGYTMSNQTRNDRRGDNKTSGGGLNPVKWWRDKQERKRLEEIFKRSGLNDPDDEKRRR